MSYYGKEEHQQNKRVGIEKLLIMKQETDMYATQNLRLLMEKLVYLYMNTIFHQMKLNIVM